MSPRCCRTLRAATRSTRPGSSPSSKNVQVVGPQTVNGVATTEYAGTYSPAAAYKSLSAGLRKLLGPTLRDMGTRPVRFTVWIDGQHLIRKAKDTESVDGHTVTTTFS